MDTGKSDSLSPVFLKGSLTSQTFCFFEGQIKRVDLTIKTAAVMLNKSSPECNL